MNLDVDCLDNIIFVKSKKILKLDYLIHYVNRVADHFGYSSHSRDEIIKLLNKSEHYQLIDNKYVIKRH